MMKRRNRSDFQSRDFGCPCGKAYLSYPALHTHIKKYHTVEENMLEHAVIPESRKQKRGRPKNKTQSKVSDELEELTMYETSILKIYEILTSLHQTAVLLQGDEETDQKLLQNIYQEVFRQQSQKHDLKLTVEESKIYEKIVESVIKNLTKHFTQELSAQIKFMIVQGYLESFIRHSSQQECIAKMGSYFSGEGGMRVAEVIYDVLMKGLQRHGHSFEMVSSNEE